MEIQTPHYQSNLNKACKDIWMEHLGPVVRELSEISKFYMSSSLNDSETIKINGAICDLLKFNNKYRELPLYLVAEAFHKGALGELEGTSKYTVRNVCIWLNEIYDKMCRIQAINKNREEDQLRKTYESDYKSNWKHHSKYGAALSKKMEWDIDRKTWERITLDKMVEMLDKGYTLDELTPDMII